MNEKQQEIKKITLPQAKKMLPFDYKNLKLKPKEIKFVAAYCSTFHQGKAYRMAGYKAKNDNVANATACRMLKKPNIIEAVNKYIDILIQPYKQRLEYMILEYWYCRAFYKIDYFYHYQEFRQTEESEEDKGDIDYVPIEYILKPLDEIEDRWKVCIDAIEEKYYNQGKIKVIRYVLGDRSEALRNLWDFIQKSKGIEENPDNIKNIGKKMTAIFDKHFDGKKILPFAK